MIIMLDEIEPLEILLIVHSQEENTLDYIFLIVSLVDMARLWLPTYIVQLIDFAFQLSF